MYWSSMIAIERVHWIHSRFVKNNEERSYEFRKECALELDMPGLGDRDKRAVLTAQDNYFQLAYRTGKVWELVDKNFDLWDRGGLKEQPTGPISRLSLRL
jgi:hypothetical protein